MTETDGIVPENFDLHDARHAYSTTPDEKQPKCPDCGSINITRKVGNHIGQNKDRHPGRWRCNCCQHHFDEPVRGEHGDE